MGLVDDLPHLLGDRLAHADPFQALLDDGTVRVKQTQGHLFTEVGRPGGGANVKLAAFKEHRKGAVLWTATFRDVHVTQHLEG